MTNTKFRKRALLSSVAMLLVALVALGSATFAWFVDDPTAKASGINATAQASTGLMIKTETDSTWSHNATLAKSITDPIILAPATPNAAGTAYFSAKAASSTASPQLNAAAAQGTEGEEGYVPAVVSKWASVNVLPHVAGTGVYHEQINLKRTVNLTGTDTEACYLTGLDLDLNTSNAMDDALTVLLVFDDDDPTNGDTVALFNADGGTISKWTTLSITTDVANADSTWTVTQAAEEFGTAGAVTGKSVVGTFSASKTQLNIEVYVFLNGAATSVYTDNADVTDLINGVTPKFALASNWA